MAEARARPKEADEDDGALGSAEVLGGPTLLPVGLRSDWPVPRVAVRGPRWGIGARLEYGLLRGLLGGLARLPQGARSRAIGAFAALAHRVDRPHNAAARVLLRQAHAHAQGLLAAGADLGPAARAFAETPLDRGELERRVRTSWRHFLELLVESEQFDREIGASARVLERFDLEIDPRVRELARAGRGSIMVTAHIGDWEAAATTMPWLGFDPFYAIAKPPRNGPLSAYIQAARERRGIRVLPRRGAMRYAGSVIESGGTLAMLLDQRARQKPVYAPFFGRPARCDRGAGVLIKRLRAPVIFGVCYRTGERWRWKLVLGPVWEPEQLAREAPEEIARRINAELERMILAAPEQYFWLHERYRGAPGA